MTDAAPPNEPANRPNVTANLVIRSEVPAGLPYEECRQFLRFDFFYSCAYCTITESEAGGIRFTIDHYEPQSIRPELRDDYRNLFYSCDTCNIYKGDTSPPLSARADGHRFFRPDEDEFDDHFRANGLRLEAKSNVGTFSIEWLELNRATLRRLRELRMRLLECHKVAAAGLRALVGFRIDQLPASVRAKAIAAIKGAKEAGKELEDKIDRLLRETARNEILDAEDPESGARQKERLAMRRRYYGLYPEQWRGPRR